MTYDALFPEAIAFEEVKSNLFKSIEYNKCVICKTDTLFIDYNFNQNPVSICSESCYYQVLEIFNYKPKSE